MNTWFRLYNEIIDDKKIRLLAFEDRWHFVAILCLKNAGELDRENDLRDELVQVALGVSGADFENLKRRLIRVGLIDSDWQPLAWSKRQFKTDDSKDRVRKYREKHRKTKASDGVTACNGDSNGQSNGSVTLQETDTETDTEITSPNGEVAGTKVPPCPHQEIIQAYHEILPELTAVREWTKTRSQYLQSRWRESQKRQSVEWWRKLFAYVRKSDFLMGRTDSPFRCDLEWIIRPGNFAKIVEGKYHS